MTHDPIKEVILYMTKNFTFIMIFIVLLSNVSLANDGLKVCTKKDAINVEKLAAIAANWDQLYKLYRSYNQCDDGAIAEGFSESVSVLLSQSWHNLDKLINIIQNDANFEIFVLNHLDESIPEERLHTIANLAINKCSGKDNNILCEKIRQRINEIEKPIIKK